MPVMDPRTVPWATETFFMGPLGNPGSVLKLLEIVIFERNLELTLCELKNKILRCEYRCDIRLSKYREK